MPTTGTPSAPEVDAARAAKVKQVFGEGAPERPRPGRPMPRSDSATKVRWDTTSEGPGRFSDVARAGRYQKSLRDAMPRLGPAPEPDFSMYADVVKDSTPKKEMRSLSEPRVNLLDRRAVNRPVPDRRSMERRTARYEGNLSRINNHEIDAFDRRRAARPAGEVIGRAGSSGTLRDVFARTGEGVKGFVKDNLPLAATLAGFGGISRLSKDLPQNIEKVIRTGRSNDQQRVRAEAAADRGQPIHSGVIERVGVTPGGGGYTETSRPDGTGEYTSQAEPTTINMTRKTGFMPMPKLAKSYKKLDPMKRMEPKGGPPETGTGKGSPEDMRDY